MTPVHHGYGTGVNRERVPVRTIAATIAMILATGLGLLIIVAIKRILIWNVVALFFAVALYPVVGWVQRRVSPGRRAVATLGVFLVAVLVIAGVVTAFVVPLARESSEFAGKVPDLVAQAREGRGPVGDLITRFHVEDYLTRNEARIRQLASGLGTPALHAVRTAAETVVGLVTIVVLAYLMVLEGPKVVGGTLSLMPPVHAERVRRIGADCAKAVTGYISGNLLISVICGALSYVVLLVMGVPFAGLIALFVAIADLIPLIGATLGAVVAAAAAFIQSVPAGIVVVVFFVVYQQLENHLLQPVILSRTVNLNPLTVILAILVGVELAGILGALLAIPVAAMIQVIARDLWQVRRGRSEDEPRVGPEEPAEGT